MSIRAVTFHRRLLRNAGSSIVGTGVNLLIGLVLMPFVIRRLGLAAYGVLSLVNALSGYAGLLDLGLGPAVVRATAQHLASNDEGRLDALRRTLSTALFLYVPIGVVAGCVVGSAGLLGALRFQMTPQELRQYQWVLGIVSVQTCLSFPFSIWTGVVGGLQDYHVLNSVGIAANLARAALTVLLLAAGFGLVSLTAAGLVLAVSGWTAAFWWAHRRIPGVRLRWAFVDRRQVNALRSVSGAMVLWSVAGYALHQMDRVVVGLIAPIAAVGLYGIGAQLVAFARNMVDSWLSTVLPAATHAHGRGADDEIRTIYLCTTRYVMLTFGVFVAPALLIGSQFLSLWIGPGLATSSAVLAWLVVATAYQSHNVVAHVILPGVGRLQFFGRFMAAYAAVVVLGQFGGGFAAGAVGVAAGTAGAVVLIESWLTPRVWRMVGVSGSEAFARIYLPAIAPALLSGVSLAALELLVPAVSWPAFLTKAAVGVSVYAAAAWQIGLTAGEREVVRQTILLRAVPPATVNEVSL